MAHILELFQVWEEDQVLKEQEKVLELKEKVIVQEEKAMKEIKQASLVIHLEFLLVEDLLD